MRHGKNDGRFGSLYVANPLLPRAPAGATQPADSSWPRIRRLVSERRMAIGAILVVALIAFELFNFDTTRFALANLFGEASFMGLQWATILAIAFCAIDFAGLGYLFAPERAGQQHREVWYLMGAWLLGATMNALMTWWAVSVTILGQDVGNELLSRSQLVEAAPAFVAALVWLTRILFIGAFSVAGGFLFSEVGRESQSHQSLARRPLPQGMPVRASEQPRRSHGFPTVTEEVPGFLHGSAPYGGEASDQGDGDFEGEENELEVTVPGLPAAAFRQPVTVMASRARSRK
jgi:hypothetical protein